ncbi:meiosis protein SPO22/ZIP4 like-domain-containing protein [Calycina marina]|uniref:Protein ZIP4 homolog n=1 Tax=Calycina marina TaxID=1763456 RepID=A0A9P7Z9X4_9HELO|nr:meiosis protein SPO22/ZIP4 like-domain-containing protein [Calycina marina]
MDLQRHISFFPAAKSLGEIGASKCEELDGNGTALWNLCTRLKRNYDTGTPQDVPIILLLARVFAFMVLYCALEVGKGTTGNVVRVMRIGIKAAKNCMGREQWDNATKICGNIGLMEGMLRKLDPDLQEGETEIHERLIAEYYILRTALAWKQNNMDLTEHMYGKSTANLTIFDPGTVESLADVLYEIGKDLLDKKEYEGAVKWLGRSNEMVKSQELDKMSTDISELRLSIAESLIRATLALQNPEATGRARYLLENLEDTMGTRLPVMLLRLEFLSTMTDETFDGVLYSNTLHKMARSMMLSESNFKLMMHHIRKLNDKSSSLACKALDSFITMRILQDGKDSWLEKVIITRIWLTISQRDSAEALEALKMMLSNIYQHTQKPASAAATLAAHTLLWKRIESNYVQGQIDTAESWCRLAMLRIFESSGEINMARMSRKLLLCALAKNDYNTARDVYGAMPDTTKNDPMTRFLMYKISIRCDDLEYASKCLEIVSRAITKDVPDPTLLYACVLDAQQVGNKQQALAALQLVMERFGSTTSNSVHLPSLLRLTIKLSSGLLDDTTITPLQDGSQNNVERLCKLFETAVDAIKRTSASSDTDMLWTFAELDWFSKNSYNLAIKYISSWTPHHLLRMLICCIAFIDRYPSDTTEQVADDLSLRKMFCEFSAATALVALARGEDNRKQSLQDYMDLRKHVDNFDRILQDKVIKLGDAPGVVQDLFQKLAVLLAFDFEAACHLKAWDQLGESILKAEACQNARVYELMADCMLSAEEAPIIVLIATLKKIINSACELDSFDNIKLAKYMRCLFQVALSQNYDVAESLLDNILSQAEESAETGQPYPSEELEWIVTRAFNHAVDLYCASKDQECLSWAQRALGIAQYYPDNGGLKRLLENRLAGLQFD